MQDLVGFGAGGFARELAFLVEEINRRRPTYRFLGYVEADPTRVGTPVGDATIVASEDQVLEMTVAAVIGIGSPQVIHRIASRFADRPNVTFPNLFHPDTVWHEKRIAIGRGNIICAGNIFTTDITIGSFNIFNLNCTYGHDVRIGSCCVFNPGVNMSGGVSVGDRCLVGTGATILQNVSIGEDAIVGAGAVVLKAVEPHTTVFGVPARPVAR
jgi:sugar O-acyltransferase (sialic acid O-acetyltransferase NeuD family)